MKGSEIVSANIFSDTTPVLVALWAFVGLPHQLSLDIISSPVSAPIASTQPCRVFTNVLTFIFMFEIKHLFPAVHLDKKRSCQY